MFNRILGLFRKAPWFEQYFVWIAVTAAIVAGLVSLWIGLMQSVWFDEAYSILVANQPLSEIVRLTGVDTHPPLYYIVLKGWAGVFGWSELALRSFSVIAMSGAVFVGALLVRRLFGVKAALFSLVFLVLAPFLLRYGFEIRMYALASLIGVTATYVLVRAVAEKDSRTQWWLYAGYAILVALGVYTLYYTAILWITHVVWLLWLVRTNKQPAFRQRWWLAYLGSVALFLPWLPTFLSQMNNGALAPISQQLTVENMVGIISFWFLYQPSWQLSGLLSLVIVGIISYLVYVLVGAFRRVSKEQRRYLVLFALYIGVPVLIVALISLLRPMYVERYLAHVSIGIALLLGTAFSLTYSKKQKWHWLPLAAFSAVLLYGVVHLAQVGNYNFQRLHIPQIEKMAEAIDCDSTILAADPYVAIELSYYLDDCTIHFYSDTAKMGGGYAPLSESVLRIAEPETELASTKRVTYVYYDEPKLAMPSSLKEASTESYGPLRVKSLQLQ
jgi:mannosyltransferase